MAASELKIGVLSRRIPIALNDQSGPVIEHVGGLTRVLPALSEFAKINWSAFTADELQDLPNQISYAEVSGQNLGNEINVYIAPVSGDDLNQSDWFCTNYIWPLLHDLPIPEIQIAELNECLASINRLGREMAMKCLDTSNDGYLVNDFQLSQVPMTLRELAQEKSTVFFLHSSWAKVIPSNALAINVLKFLAKGMLAADVIEFQTHKDLEAFEVFVSEHLPLENVTEKLVVNPVSVDVQQLQKESTSFEEPISLREDEISYVHIARSDPIKNTLASINAFAELARGFKDSAPRSYLDLYIVPSRQQWPIYRELLAEIAKTVEQSNSDLASLDYIPIRLHIGNDYQRASRALTRYDFLIACSVSDGLNLVVKEGAVLNNRNGVIISTESVGAMAELGRYCVVAEDADEESITAALHLAADLDSETRQSMCFQLKAQITEFDASLWAQSVVANFRILEKV